MMHLRFFWSNTFEADIAISYPLFGKCLFAATRSTTYTLNLLLNSHLCGEWTDQSLDQSQPSSHLIGSTVAARNIISQMTAISGLIFNSGHEIESQKGANYLPHRFVLDHVFLALRRFIL